MWFGIGSLTVAVEVRAGVPRSDARTSSEMLSCCSRSRGASTVITPLFSPIAKRFAPGGTTSEKLCAHVIRGASVRLGVDRSELSEIKWAHAMGSGFGAGGVSHRTLPLAPASTSDARTVLSWYAENERCELSSRRSCLSCERSNTGELSFTSNTCARTVLLLCLHRINNPQIRTT